tara:strand:- start:1979 stop:2089 length:111 start_codon:yes stop_codon:yes gene_type:complete
VKEKPYLNGLWIKLNTNVEIQKKRIGVIIVFTENND